MSEKCKGDPVMVAIPTEPKPDIVASLTESDVYVLHRHIKHAYDCGYMEGEVFDVETSFLRQSIQILERITNYKKEDNERGNQNQPNLDL